MSAYATLSDIKQYLDITVSDDDALLSSLLLAATAIIETHTGRRFRSVVETRTVRTAVGSLLFLRDDVTSLIAITDASSALIDVTSVYPMNDRWPARVLVRDAGWPAPIQVTATWGYSDVPPVDITQICVRLAAYLYRQKDAQVFDTLSQQSLGVMTLPAGVPADIKQLLDNYRVREVAI